MLLALEGVVRFVQDSITNAMDRQKGNADKHGIPKVLLFNVGHLVLLYRVNLPKHVATNVGSRKLLPKFIGLARVLHRKGNAYTIELPHRMRTHPTFYVGRLRPYHHHEVSSSGKYNRHAQDLQEILLDPSSPIGRTRTPIGRPIDKVGCVATTPPKRDAPASLVWHDHTDRVSVAGDDQPPRATLRDTELIFPPPPQPLMDSHSCQRFQVKRIVSHRDVKGQRTSYLVRWRGYPPSHDSWVPRA